MVFSLTTQQSFMGQGRWLRLPDLPIRQNLFRLKQSAPKRQCITSSRTQRMQTSFDPEFENGNCVDAMQIDGNSSGLSIEENGQGASLSHGSSRVRAKE